jgi:cytohesin
MKRKDFLDEMKRKEFLDGTSPWDDVKRREILDEAPHWDDTPAESIWEAAVNKDWETVKQWLALDPSLITVRGEVPNSFDLFKNSSLLHWAALETDLEMMRYLISHGSDINAKDADDCTPMFNVFGKKAWAAEAVKLLIHKGADVNAKAGTGESLLHVVALRCDEPTCALLLDYGANLESRDKNGLTALGWAVALCYGKEDKVICFYEAQEHPLGSECMAKLLLQRGANINIQDNKGRSLLHLSVIGQKHKKYRQSAMKAMKFLLANGADITIQDDEGKTPLDYADAEEVRELFQIQKTT